MLYDEEGEQKKWRRKQIAQTRNSDILSGNLSEWTDVRFDAELAQFRTAWTDKELSPMYN